MKRILLFLAASLISACSSTTQKPLTDKELIEKAITELSPLLYSDDLKDIAKGCDIILPNQKDIEALFGENSDCIWPAIEKSNRAMRSTTPTIKPGKTLSVEVSECNEESKYGKVLKLLPQATTLYRTTTRCEKGESEGGPFLILDGRVIFIKNL